MTEMELLHNYSTYTCYTLERNPNCQSVWRINVPQISFSFPFVMNAILALSALHLAHSRPATKDHYTNLAMQHHERGLEQVATMLPNFTQTNATAICAFSSLTSIISFAKPKRPGDFLLIGQEGIADWLMLLRGTKHIIDTYKDTLFSGDMSQMFRTGFRRVQLWIANANGHHEFLEELFQSIKAVSTDEKDLETYRTAIRELGQSFSLVENSQVQTTETADVFIWFFQVSDDYLTLLYAKRQEAIAIFAFYCVLLKQMEWSWYMKGWSTHLISVIWRNMDHEHRVWIQWPLEQIVSHTSYSR
ncbi:MAG: hypothetical protein MMC23_005287 [Stictis urceolatum]|nr:hypothetical protein [Stictis urceolata]